MINEQVKVMTKLEELLAAYDAVHGTVTWASSEAARDAWAAYWGAWDAFEAELKKTQKENSDD
jgi:hypothetical protein